MGSDIPINSSVIFFDGVCNLCNSSVLFIIKRDKKSYFQFASLQSNYAKKVLPDALTKEDNLSSIILMKDGKVFQKSSAALKIAYKLSGLWPLMIVFMIIPKFIRDWVYDIIAKNRYKWFGKKDQCMIPSPELKIRFLDQVD